MHQSFATRSAEVKKFWSDKHRQSSPVLIALINTAWEWNTGPVAKFIFKLSIWGKILQEKLWQVRARDLLGGRRNRMVTFSLSARGRGPRGRLTRAELFRAPGPASRCSLIQTPNNNSIAVAFCIGVAFHSLWKWMNPSVHTKSLSKSAVAGVSRCQRVETPSLCFRNWVTVL